MINQFPLLLSNCLRCAVSKRAIRRDTPQKKLHWNVFVYEADLRPQTRCSFLCEHQMMLFSCSGRVSTLRAHQLFINRRMDYRTFFDVRGRHSYKWLSDCICQLTQSPDRPGEGWSGPGSSDRRLGRIWFFACVWCVCAVWITAACRTGCPLNVAVWFSTSPATYTDPSPFRD